jgi:hypothetical protein
MSAMNKPMMFDAKIYDKFGNCILVTKGHTARAIMKLVGPLYPSWHTVIITYRVAGLKGDVPIVADRLVKIIRRS